MIGIRQNDQDLVHVVADTGIGNVGALIDVIGKGFKYGLAGHVPVNPIGGFKVVHCQQNNRKGAPVALQAAHFLVQPLAPE